MKYLLLWAVGCLVGTQLLAATPAKAGFRAGAATSNITPFLGGDIVGNFVRPVATNIHDELHARCLVLDDGKTRLALVVCDVLGISRDVSIEARKLIQENTGIPPENVLISAVHTHSACDARGNAPLNEYNKFVARRIADGVQTALGTLRPAQVAFLTAEAPEHVFNRRWVMKPGTAPPNPFGGIDQVKMNPPGGSPDLVEPAGPTDPTISILALREPEGRPIAVYSAYSLHYVGGVQSCDISADYYGMYCEELKRLLKADDQDPPFVALMANGTSADINSVNFRKPRPKLAPYVKMRAIANDIAHKVCTALAKAKYCDDVTLAARYQELKVHSRRPTPEQLAWAKETLAKPATKSGKVDMPRVYATRTMNLFKTPETLPVPLQVLRIGPVCVGSMPTEVFCEIGLEFRKRCPIQPAFMVSLAHDYMGYLPTPRHFPLGGYETWIGTSRLEPQASEKMLAALLEMAAEKGDSPGRPDFVASRDFSWKSLIEPENLFWPAYFWYWNGPLTPDVLRRQLADMASHEARSVCVVPMPREFRPATMNTLMDVDYLSPEFFQRVKVAVDEAARLGMNYWIYDEGGWPSGLAAGRVVQTRPDTAVRVLRCNADGKWTPDIVANWPPGKMGVADLLNPQSTRTFISLTHERYAAAVGSHFGKTIKMTFTDEPKYQPAVPGKVVPWPLGAEDVFRGWFGYDAMEKLDAFRITNMKDLSTAQKKVRVDMFDFWSRRFRDAYFLPLRDWARQHGLASGGHLDNENETFAPVSRGFGSVMRPLRAMDVPGVDVIWRQIWPGQENHHFPKFASSAAHQNGTALALTESFGVYGNGLTPAQMKWLVDYQYVRGLTLLVCGVYPLSTRDHLMLGERPHFGAVDPLWDFLPDFHRYVARLGYLLSCGKPAIDIGLYYPVRDLWASANPDDAASHDALARALLRRQCDFDIVDDDLLSARTARVENGALVAGAMRYRTMVVGPANWMPQVVQDRLKTLEAAGGQVIRIDDLSQIDAALAKIAPTIRCDPPSPDLRVLVRRWPGGGAAFLFNEGQAAYSGAASLKIEGNLYQVEPSTGSTRLVRIVKSSDGRWTIPLTLAAGESMLLVSSPQAQPAGVALPAAHKVVQSIELADGWTARVDRQYAVGEHDYEVRQWDKAGFKPVSLGGWATTLGLGQDFSGHVTYRRKVKIPETLRGGRLVLDLGHVEYAARVRVDGQNVGSVLWNPWRLELPSLTGRSEFEIEITVSNTLANELTSQRVRDAWSKRKGPGWPGPYHQRELKFETESRGGGLLGPVRLQLATP